MADQKPSPQSRFAAQWTEPADIFSGLLILGADVIQLACAAMRGNGVRDPSEREGDGRRRAAVLGALGENRLLRCAPEVEVKVVNLKSGYGRANQSWLLSRFYKTCHLWMPARVREHIGCDGALASGRGLCLAVLPVEDDAAAGRTRAGLGVVERLRHVGPAARRRSGASGAPEGLVHLHLGVAATVAPRRVACAHDEQESRGAVARKRDPARHHHQVQQAEQERLRAEEEERQRNDQAAGAAV